MGTCIPLNTQLNVEKWEEFLAKYWDKKLLQFLKFCFLLAFNRNCSLSHVFLNQKSAKDHPSHVQAYLQEEIAMGAIEGPFEKKTFFSCHVSPFMSRPKPNSDSRRVTVDFSWPNDESVNYGVDKHGYMGADFALTFPTIDHFTSAWTKLGRGSHIYKIDVSRAFWHLKMDPFDFDSLGIYWNGLYINTCLPFGSRHESQFCQRTKDEVRYITRQHGYDVINYIDDFLGLTPLVVDPSFCMLYTFITELGLKLSAKNLVRPTT